MSAHFHRALIYQSLSSLKPFSAKYLKCIEQVSNILVYSVLWVCVLQLILVSKYPGECGENSFEFMRRFYNEDTKCSGLEGDRISLKGFSKFIELIKPLCCLIFSFTRLDDENKEV